jgi:2-keto-4-pentenoate hydratase/2-oxohepta-3-ene-1,7-dioic acid hydratase in catechol pathway
MKFVLYQAAGMAVAPGILTDAGIVDISAHVEQGHTPQLTMQWLIDHYERIKPALQEAAVSGRASALESVRLLPPLPRPGKILNCIGNYWEHAQRDPKPLKMFLKNPDAVVGPGDTIVLPDFTEPWAFMHEAELAVVIKGPAKKVDRRNWRDAVFGYTCIIDVTARGEGRKTWPSSAPMTWLGKSFDTFAPLGPCIVTADEVEDPNALHVQFWNDGQLRHNYNTDDMEHPVAEIVEYATTVMTLNSGDVLSCGTNHEGLGFLQDGETVEICIHGIGRMSLTVEDPLKRTWERGVYMGQDSTNHEAVRRHKPATVLLDSNET